MKSEKINLFDLACGKIHMRRAMFSDVDVYFSWVNEESVRVNSINSEPIEYESHVKWFTNKMSSQFSEMYIFYLSDETNLIGQVRIDRLEDVNIIDVSVDKNYRGKGNAVVMLNLAINDFSEHFPSLQVTAYVKIDNLASIKQFSRAMFKQVDQLDYEGYKCIKFQK